MANFLITDANTSTVGSSSDDLFVINTAAGLGATVQGLAGDDTFTAATSADLVNVKFQAGAGNDSLTLSTASYQLASIYGGAGDDLISAHSASARNTTFQGGGGNDTIILTAGTITSSLIGLNAGADYLEITGGASANFSSTNINMGGGADTITLDSASFSTGTINLGGGADYFTANAFSGEAVTINLDNLGTEYYGNDTINLGGFVGTAAMVRGGGGADRIMVSATLQGDSFIAGNYGKDSITVSAFSAGVSATINGGAGSDTIAITASVLTGTLLVANGGGGGDWFDLSAALTGAGFTIDGGAGVDTIDLGAASTGADIILNYDSASESNISGYDVVSAAPSSGNAIFHIRAGGYLSATTALSTGALLSNGLVTASTAGVISFTSTIGGGVTARVEAIDELVRVGQVVTFADSSGVDYVFIQGGAANSGTEDDLLVQINTGMTATGSFLINGGTAVEINLM